MTPREANVFLTAAALLDPRMKRVDPEDQADMATGWATILDDVALDDALAALRAHYRASKLAIMPADVLERVGVVDVVPSSYVDVTDRVVAESKARALARAGVTEAEYDEHANDAGWLRKTFPWSLSAQIAAMDENGDPE